MKSYTLLAVFILSVAYASTQEIPTRMCPSGEHSVLYCPQRAEPTCDNPTIHTFHAGACDIPECFCNHPTIRNKQTGQCVDYSECPKHIRN